MLKVRACPPSRGSIPTPTGPTRAHRVAALVAPDPSNEISAAESIVHFLGSNWHHASPGACVGACYGLGAGMKRSGSGIVIKLDAHRLVRAGIVYVVNVSNREEAESYFGNARARELNQLLTKAYAYAVGQSQASPEPRRQPASAMAAAQSPNACPPTCPLALVRCCSS